ncbi:MAG: FGGY-family carbohydrate kinase [Limnochordia bacterium]|jgi:xylulokinase
MYMLGIDIGTTNWKVVAYNPNGVAAARWSCPARTERQPGGWAVYDPNAIWSAVCTGIREVLSQLAERNESPESIASVAVTSVGESGLFLDEAGQALGPAIAWFDPRTQDINRYWTDQVGSQTVYEVTGFPPQYIASINKMMWIKEAQPELYARARRWLCIADYVAFRLCGEAVMDYSLASRTMAFDIRRRRWSESLLSLADLPAALMPELAPSGTKLGVVHKQAQAETGLTDRTVVATGGHDHICGALAVGVCEPGQCLDSLGTAEAILLTLDRPVLSPELMESGFALGCHTAPDRYYFIAVMQSAGGTVEWLCETLGEAEAERAAGDRGRLYSLLMEEAAKAPAGSDGLLFLPHLLGSVCPTNESARGAWVGLQPHHRRAHLLRSAVEGLAHESFSSLSRMEHLSSIKGDSVVVIGGGTRNDMWMQAKADVAQRPMHVPLTDEATTLGAAILGAVAAGLHKDVRAALEAVKLEERVVTPNPELAGAYNKAHEAFTRIYPGLVDVFDALAQDAT